ncbi:MAG: protein-disulfide reductase DsbD N-terminal domain-containing protein [Chitinophagaceae bacterium]|nr:protein-disulfide reductase DsbD N-terminal domain-containing protein [Chitinophagaceae bacterium]
MKKFLFLFLVITGMSFYSFAQVKNPVKWSFESKKIDAKNYELIITASIDPGWHIYTIDHSGDIGVATSFTFNKNPLGDLKGNVKTSAKPKKSKDPSTGEMVAFYEGKVVFSQTVTLKSPVKTTYTGSVEFMACDDKMCLPPSEKNFTINLQ